MSASAALVILAAGLGTRFGGKTKQLAPIGGQGETLMEYSVYDAARAGFDRVVIIIRRDIEAAFRELVGDKLSKHIRVDYCFQEAEDLPAGFTLPAGRTKPWGTVHAVLSARKLIDSPFLIINADDYYGADAYESIYRFLTAPERKDSEQCMGGFILKNTVSSTGAVTRGICTADENGMLSSVTETYRITSGEKGIISEGNVLDGESLVSMNMWGCSAALADMLEDCFEGFLRRAAESGTTDTAEYALPTAFDELIRGGRINVKILPTHSRWYGMTYQDDVSEVTSAFAEMTRSGKYPSPLFG